MTPASVILALDEGFNRSAWHGPNLRGSLRGVSAAAAAWRPAPDRHNVWEEVVHCAYWKYAVRRKLLGLKRGSFPLEGSDWFTRPAGEGAGRRVAASDAAWKKDLALLDEQHRLLRDALAEFLARATPSPAQERLIRGAAFHDVYHAGQIQLLKRLQAAGRAFP